ncbi:hypothetical protein FHS83_002268 [Rhizomicrobium palustre]|uniref:Microcin J25-processing protein McjB C-terminal domain-containing protein n=1 Tax=Rhizomicrobium palustre TaxID=189966 RepID=A0A846N1D9_9PROT|nr:lasso peptide biosynthesis B2 protein [Rhizomicrobium palustre]NIK88950.1 hypothetical protein [Rhizomicrobium palustre]
MLPSAKKLTESKLLRNRAAWLQRFARLSRQQRILLLEASLLLVIMRLGIGVFPFRALAATSGKCVSPDHPVPEPSTPKLPGDAAATAMKISWAVRCASRRLPFKFVCLPQAMAANWMLRRRKLRPVLHLGIKASPNAPMQAHAWLDCDGVPVTGYPVAAGFGEVAKFQ